MGVSVGVSTISFFGIVGGRDHGTEMKARLEKPGSVGRPGADTRKTVCKFICRTEKSRPGKGRKILTNNTRGKEGYIQGGKKVGVILRNLRCPVRNTVGTLR